MKSQVSNRFLALTASSLFVAATLGTAQARDATTDPISTPGAQDSAGMSQGSQGSMNQPGSRNQGALSQASQDFITEAAKGNLGEIVLGTRAQNATENQDVRQFGLRLVEDHGTANQRLKAIADANGVAWPEKPMDKQVKLEEKLSKLSGEEFDRKFMEKMVKEHEKTIEEYEKMTGKAEDGPLKEYVQTTLPVLKQHLELAKSVNQSLGKSAD